MIIDHYTFRFVKPPRFLRSDLPEQLEQLKSPLLLWPNDADVQGLAVDNPLH